MTTLIAKSRPDIYFKLFTVLNLPYPSVEQLRRLHHHQHKNRYELKPTLSSHIIRKPNNDPEEAFEQYLDEKGLLHVRDSNGHHFVSSTPYIVAVRRYYTMYLLDAQERLWTYTARFRPKNVLKVRMRLVAERVKQVCGEYYLTVDGVMKYNGTELAIHDVDFLLADGGYVTVDHVVNNRTALDAQLPTIVISSVYADRGRWHEAKIYCVVVRYTYILCADGSIWLVVDGVDFAHQVRTPDKVVALYSNEVTVWALLCTGKYIVLD